MKLNPDCIRDILLVVEEIPDINHRWRFDEETIPELFPNYSFDEVMYHIRQCQLNNFFFKQPLISPEQVASSRIYLLKGMNFLLISEMTLLQQSKIYRC